MLPPGYNYFFVLLSINCYPGEINMPNMIYNNYPENSVKTGLQTAKRVVFIWFF
jgi:hypothetical protein